MPFLMGKNVIIFSNNVMLHLFSLRPLQYQNMKGHQNTEEIKKLEVHNCMYYVDSNFVNIL